MTTYSHGPQQCRACFVDAEPAATTIQTGRYRLVNDPGYWGAADPVVLVLGQSKGRTQWEAWTSGFDSVAFAGSRDRIAAVLERIGITISANDIDSRFTADETEIGFASLVRCSLSHYDGRSSGSPVTQAMPDGQAGQWVRTCMRRWLTELNPRLRLVVLLGITDTYVNAVITRLRELHPTTFRSENPTSVRAAGVLWTFAQHPSPMSENHYRTWIGREPHRKRTNAAEAVLLARVAQQVDSPVPITARPAATSAAPHPAATASPRSATRTTSLARTIRRYLDEHPELERRGALGAGSVKMSDWRTPAGAVFAYENETGALWAPDTLRIRSLTDAIGSRTYPASDLWVKRNTAGTPLYGRHSNLRTIPELRDADLLRFNPADLADAVRIVTTMLQS